MNWLAMAYSCKRLSFMSEGYIALPGSRMGSTHSKFRGIDP